MNNYPEFTFPEDIIDRNARIASKNFSGEQKSYGGQIVNEAGCQTFCYELGEDQELADSLYAAGWNVGQHRPTEQHPVPGYYIPVAVRWDKIRPTIKSVVLRDGRKVYTLLDEETIAGLDSVTIGPSMIAINASHHPYKRKDGSIGIKAYLKSARFLVIPDDPFDDEDDEGFDDDLD